MALPFPPQMSGMPLPVPPGLMPPQLPPGQPMTPPMAPPLGPAPMPPMPMGAGGLPPQLGSPLALLGAPPQAMPLPMQMGGAPNPMDALADPQVMIALLGLIQSEMELQNGPVYPKWYKPATYPKPDAALTQEKAQQDRELHRKLLYRFQRDRDTLRAATVGMFTGDAEDGIAPYRDLSLAMDAKLIIALLAGIEVRWEATARKTSERDEAQDKEDFCHASRLRQAERHAAMYGTALGADEIKNLLTYGRLVCRRLCDYDAESDEVPIKADLIDPATVFPTWEGDRGLGTITHIFSATVAEVCASFCTDDDPSGAAIRSKLLAQRTDAKGQEIRRRLDDTVEVIEYWDRRWHVVSADSVEILTYEHKYGFVPWVYVISPEGDAGNINAPDAIWRGARSFAARQDDLASKGLSVVGLTRFTHEQREAILARLFNELKKSNNPSRTFEQSPTVYGDAPTITNAEGGISMLRAGEEKEVPTPIPAGLNLVPPLMAALNEANQRGLMPASSYGLTQNANESGSAIEGLNESGRDKLTPWMIAGTEYHRQCGQMDLRLERDWGHLLGSDGYKGKVTLPRMKPEPNGEPTFTLTPETLRQVGIKIQAKMTSLRLQNLGPMGNAIMMWHNMGLIEKTEALEMRGVRDPEATLRRIEIEQFKDSPEYKKAMMLKWMRQEGETEAANVAMKIIMDQGQQGGGPGGQPGPPSSANTPGLSLPGLGMPPGTQGGAPPGGTAPQMASVPGGQLPGPPPVNIGQTGP